MIGKVRGIVKLGANVLRLKARAVENVHDDEIVKVMEDLYATLAASEGVGLAAPQISASWRIIIVASRASKRYPLAPEMPATLMINPSFKALNDVIHKDWEGCLSIEGIRAKVPRYTKIEVRYMQASGEWVSAVFENFVARIFQHEYDHLEGLVYLDRVEDNRAIISETEFFRLAEFSR